MNDANYKFYLKAKDFLKENKYNEAIAIFRDIHKLEPNDSLNKFQLARLLIRNSKTLQEGKNMLEQMKDDVFAALELGKLELEEGHTNKARYYFEKLLNTKNRLYAMLELGKLELEEGHTNKARYYFEKLLNTKNRLYAMLELGKLELKEGHTNKARYYFEKLLNTRNKVYAMLELGKLELQEGNNDKARYYFEKSLNTKNRLYAMLELGKLELQEGNNDKARYYFEYLLNTKNDEYAILELGRLELQEGNKDKARYYFEKLLNTKNDEYAMLELGRLELQEGNKDKARRYFEYLLNTKNDRYAKEELLFLNINEGKYEDAYKLLDSISDIMEKNVYSNTKNFLEYKLGISDRNSNNQVNYFNSQLYNYDENVALDHISKHLDENDKKKVHSVFYSDVDLRELLLMVKDKIGNAVPNRSTIIDKYIVNCDDSIATIESKETKYIEVITFSNTKNIITMYPILAPLNELDKPKQLKRRK